MTTTVAQMTKEELREMIQAIVETVIEQKLAEIFSDPDEGLELREIVHDSLLLQKKAVAAGERGQPFEDVVQRLGLE